MTARVTQAVGSGGSTDDRLEDWRMLGKRLVQLSINGNKDWKQEDFPQEHFRVSMPLKGKVSFKVRQHP